MALLTLVILLFLTAPVLPASAVVTSCTDHFFETRGDANISVANMPNGDAIVASYGSNLTGIKGHIFFFGSPDSSIWFDQAPGRLSYGYTSPRAISGYVSCSTGLSQKIIRALFSQNQYSITVYNYSQVLVLATCMNTNTECAGGTVNGVAMHSTTGSYQNLFLSLYWYVTNVTTGGLEVSFVNGLSSVFIFGISTSQVGYVSGTVSPKQVTLLVNGSATLITNGLVYMSLHFGTYNFTFLKKGYYNLSIVEIVYGGVVSPLNVRLGSPSGLALARLNKLLGYSVLVLLFSLAIVAPLRRLHITKNRT